MRKASSRRRDTRSSKMLSLSRNQRRTSARTPSGGLKTLHREVRTAPPRFPWRKKGKQETSKLGRGCSESKRGGRKREEGEGAYLGGRRERVARLFQRLPNQRLRLGLFISQ